MALKLGVHLHTNIFMFLAPNNRKTYGMKNLLTIDSNFALSIKFKKQVSLV